MEKIKSGIYNPETVRKIESKWREYWYKNNVFLTADPRNPDKPNFYCLDMFPYPSGYGLHVGHPVGYIASDIISRYKRMKGFNVLHPMGWDAFGLPTERYAIKTGEHPQDTTVKNAENYKNQMNLMGLSYDWSREFSTTDPDYYKWTQLIFLRLYNSWFDEEMQQARPISELKIPAEIAAKGELAVSKYQDARRLVYYADSVVNWCPALNTVVANEEVMSDGRTENGYEVIRRPMRQVMMRITAYSDRLLKGLESLDWPESIKEQQRTWIGKTNGVEITFKGVNKDIDITVFTTRIDTIFGASFLVIAPELEIIPEITSDQYRNEVNEYVKSAIAIGEKERKQKTEKTGVNTGYFVKNPFTGENIPVYVADYVLKDHGTGAVMGVGCHDTRDFDFCKVHGLTMRPLFAPADPELRKKVINCDIPWVDDGDALELDFPIYKALNIAGKSTDEAAEIITDYTIKNKWGKEVVHYKIRDWVFSRQRYWGEPIPLVHLENGITIPIPESDLPLELPVLKDYSPAGEGKSALAKATDFVNYTDNNGNKGERELSTMPQWAGSCWYSLRFMDPANTKWLVDPEIEEAWGAVDLYIGGAEHATLHLLYARFWYLAMSDLGIIKTKEPFKKLVNQGMLTSFAYKTNRGIIIPIDDVEENDGQYYVRKTSEYYNDETAGQLLQKVRTKMSKSLRNVVNPDDVVKEYGADSFRVHLMFMGPVEGGREWETKNIVPTVRHLAKFFSFVTGGKEEGVRDVCPEKDELPEVITAMNTAIKGIEFDFESMKYNTAISKIMICYNNISTHVVSKTTLEQFVLLLAPLAPFMADELWQRLGHPETINFAKWPEQRETIVTQQSSNVVIMLNGKKRLLSCVIDSEMDEENIHSFVVQKLIERNIILKESDQLIIVRDNNTNRVKLVNILAG
jgi:leucyl-tRNA synthetase